MLSGASPADAATSAGPHFHPGADSARAEGAYSSLVQDDDGSTIEDALSNLSNLIWVKGRVLLEGDTTA
jgi:hypothetical protein